MTNPMTEARTTMLAAEAAKELRGEAADWRVSAFRAGGISVRALRRTFGADLNAAVAYASTLPGVDGTRMAQIDLANAVDGSLACAVVGEAV